MSNSANSNVNEQFARESCQLWAQNIHNIHTSSKVEVCGDAHITTTKWAKFQACLNWAQQAATKWSDADRQSAKAELVGEAHQLITVKRTLLYKSFVYSEQQLFISKKIFRAGRMALSERTRSVRGVRDTPVADYSSPSINTMRRVVYLRPIAVSPSLRVLLVSYFKRSPWRCGQLWQYVGMGPLGTRLHRDCNAMGDTANISPLVPSTSAQNAILFLIIIHIIPSHQICGAIDNPSLVPSVTCLTTSSYLWIYVGAADNISHAENLQSNGCQCFSHLYKFRDGMQVTRVFRYCGERKG